MGRVAQDQKARELAVVVCSHQSSGFDRDKRSVDPRSSEWEALPRQLVAPLPHTWNKVLTSLIAQSRIPDDLLRVVTQCPRVQLQDGSCHSGCI